MSALLNGHQVECNVDLMKNIVGSHLFWIFGSAEVSKINLMTEKIVAAYDESHRGHHNLLHLREMLSLFASHQHEFPLEEGKGIALGIIYHDSVYRRPQDEGVVFDLDDTGSMSNEELSIEAMCSESQEFSYTHSSIINIAASAIKITASDQVSEIKAPFEKFVHDIDYWVLGSPPPRYRAYRVGIQKEYSFDSNGNCILPVYVKGRRAFLESQLGNQIFLTEEFSRRFESQAQKNIQNEISWLASF